jgi:uncharacterized membrane protein
MGPGWDMNFGGWIWMGVWIVALLVMVWFITRAPDSHPVTQQPLDILRTRFARGVLDPEKEPRT